MARSKAPAAAKAEEAKPNSDEAPAAPVEAEAVVVPDWPGEWPEELPDGLYPRLLLAQAHGGSISKSGHNEHHDYSYVRAEDVIRDASKILSRAGLVAKVGPWEIKLTEGSTRGGGRSVECEAKSTLTIVNPEAPEETIDFPIIGTGTDSPGDKAIYKAQTGGKKYAWQDALTLAFGDDPEDDSSPGARGAAEQNARGSSAPAQSGPPYGRPLKDQDKAFILGEVALLLSTGEGPNAEAAKDLLVELKDKLGYVPFVVADALHKAAAKLRELDPELAAASPAAGTAPSAEEDAAEKKAADAAQAAAEQGDPAPAEDAPAAEPESDLPPPDMDGLEQPDAGGGSKDDDDIPF